MFQFWVKSGGSADIKCHFESRWPVNLADHRCYVFTELESNFQVDTFLLISDHF